MDEVGKIHDEIMRTVLSHERRTPEVRARRFKARDNIEDWMDNYSISTVGARCSLLPPLELLEYACEYKGCKKTGRGWVILIEISPKRWWWAINGQSTTRPWQYSHLTDLSHIRWVVTRTVISRYSPQACTARTLPGLVPPGPG